MSKSLKGLRHFVFFITQGPDSPLNPYFMTYSWNELKPMKIK